MPSFTVFKGSKDGALRKSVTTKPDELKGDDVLVRITASGVCGTGHEGVGVVERVGPDVKTLKQGDRVGWGYETDSCGHCEECLHGTENYCPERHIFGDGNTPDQGSFGSHAVWREAFLHAIPEGMSDETAAPLQCGGATTFTALQGLNPGDAVGIMGVGGLGHLAIQFAAKLGYRVVVFSGTDAKKEQALKLGAHEFVATCSKGLNNTEEQLSTTARLNRLLVTTASQPDWDLILPVMAPRSAIYPLSVSDAPLRIPYMPLITRGIAVQGSLVAPRGLHRRMLAFAALHGVEPIVERYRMDEEGIGRAMERLERGQVTFRAVLID